MEAEREQKLPVLSTSSLRKGEESRGPAHREDSAGWWGELVVPGPKEPRKRAPKAVALHGSGRDVPVSAPHVGSRDSLEDPALRGPLGLPWGHGWSFSAQSWGGGQLITLVPVPVASPRPPLPPVLCQPRVVCPRGTAPRGSASLLRVPQEAGSRDQRTLSLCESPKPQPLRFPRVLIASCAPCQAHRTGSDRGNRQCNCVCRWTCVCLCVCVSVRPRGTLCG